MAKDQPRQAIPEVIQRHKRVSRVALSPCLANKSAPKSATGIINIRIVRIKLKLQPGFFITVTIQSIARAYDCIE